ncbi:MAG TPA: tetratricopeptide repeat protein [Pseudomonadota bacterium]|jgi:tetratricopeptide (TPR) repeat protein|nr:tetratricopeptide repeat protein [Pseudomonadota bacterium]
MMINLASWTRRLALGAVLIATMPQKAAAQADAGSLAQSPAPKKKDDGCLRDNVCRTAYQKALALYDEGRYEEALTGFQSAYSRRQMPWLLLNIGRTVQRLGRPKEAISYYERYKKADPNIDPETERRVNKYIEQAQALLEQTPAQADMPRPDPVVQTGNTNGTPINPNLTPQPQPPLNLTPPQPTPTPAETQPVATPIYKKWWFWTIIGGVVAAGVVGTAVGVTASAKKDPLPAQPEPFQPGDTVLNPQF